jgi:hypothetical protein
MSTVLPLEHHRPPRLYRLARLFRRLSVVVLVVLIVFVATAIYSAARVVQSSPQAGGFSPALAGNNTLEISGSVAFANPGFYPVTGFSVAVRVLNETGILLGSSTNGPTTLNAGGTTVFPVSIFIPVEPGGPAASLLVTDQTLNASVWGNATFAWLFPVSVHFAQNRSWGAPFADLSVAPGTPVMQNGTTVVPVSLSFSNDASFLVAGNLALLLAASNGVRCGNTTYTLDVPGGSSYMQTQDVTLSPGCSLAGGTAQATYTGSGVRVTLPPEPL